MDLTNYKLTACMIDIPDGMNLYMWDAYDPVTGESSCEGWVAAEDLDTAESIAKGYMSDHNLSIATTLILSASERVGTHRLYAQILSKK